MRQLICIISLANLFLLVLPESKVDTTATSVSTVPSQFDNLDVGRQISSSNDTKTGDPHPEFTKVFESIARARNLDVTNPETRADQRLILAENVKCGIVPIYEHATGRSYNGSLLPEPNSTASDGKFRILHGLDAIFGEWPWIVRLAICISPQVDCSYCTGSLLNARWFITAGHCAVDLSNSDMSKYSATLALYNLISPDAESFTLNIDRVVLHPDYNDLNNDLALFRLEHEVEFNDYIHPICIIDQTRNIVSRTSRLKCYSVGYGLTDDMNMAIKLQKIEIRAMYPNECNGDTINNTGLRQGSVCVGPPAGKIGGSCKGDSGGPDLCYNPATNQWLLFGTVSYGPNICDREVGDKWLTVSADISNYRTWIITSILANS